MISPKRTFLFEVVYLFMIPVTMVCMLSGSSFMVPEVSMTMATSVGMFAMPRSRVKVAEFIVLSKASPIF